jgi:hypothetical protein
MIRHVILYKFRAPVSEEQRQNALDTLRALDNLFPRCENGVSVNKLSLQVRLMM